MRKTLLRRWTWKALLLLPCVAAAQVSTVVLSSDTKQDFVLRSGVEPVRLQFDVPAEPGGAKVTRCSLRVVSSEGVDGKAGPRRSDQDVLVLQDEGGTERAVGSWAAYYEGGVRVFEQSLRPTACSSGTTKLVLDAPRSPSSWRYFGGASLDPGMRPRLLITWAAGDGRFVAGPARSTPWRYYREGDKGPTAFFEAALLLQGPDAPILSNPVWIDGALYVIATLKGGGLGLHRLNGSQSALPLPKEVPVQKGSFAAATAWGRLQLLTGSSIHSFDVSGGQIQDRKKVDKISIDAEERPVAGPDGTLYFKNVRANGSIVAYNPALDEIWRTDLKPTKTSPIALSADGRVAFVLAELAVNNSGSRKADGNPRTEVGADGAKTSTFALLRIETDTGKGSSHAIYKCKTRTGECPDGEKLRPSLHTLFEPAVVSKSLGSGKIVDYVFVAANHGADSAGSGGLLQLMTFRRSEPVKGDLVWSIDGEVSAAPVASANALTGNPLFVAQGGKLKRIAWYNVQQDAKGAFEADKLQVETLRENASGVHTLLVDGADSIFLGIGDRPTLPATSYTNGGSGTASFMFAPDGALIAYGDRAVFDRSPNWGKELKPATLASGTIYSADAVDLLPVDPPKSGEHVKIKARKIKLMNGFTWPNGASLGLSSMP